MGSLYSGLSTSKVVGGKSRPLLRIYSASFHAEVMILNSYRLGWDAKVWRVVLIRTCVAVNECSSTVVVDLWRRDLSSKVQEF